MLTEIISKTVADKTVDSILKRIERAVPVPEPGDGGFDAAMRQAFNMGAACMAAQIKNGPVPTKRIALMGEVAASRRNQLKAETQAEKSRLNVVRACNR